MILESKCHILTNSPVGQRYEINIKILSKLLTVYSVDTELLFDSRFAN